MDIADEFQEIRIFFADDGFIPVLEEMAAPFMPLIEGDSMAGH